MENKKTITYERLTEAIYQDLANTDNVDINVIEDEEFNKAYYNFYNKYIEPVCEKSFDEGWEMTEKFKEAVFCSSRKCFNAGFEAAVTLLTHGGDIHA